MNENVEKQNRLEQVRPIVQRWLIYLARILFFALGIAALNGVSFLFTGGFSARAYSDRMFTVGILTTMVGVFVFITIAGTRRNMGLPTIARNPEDARRIMEHSQELREKAEKRYDAGSQVWAVGIACMALSILFFFVLSILGY